MTNDGDIAKLLNKINSYTEQHPLENNICDAPERSLELLLRWNDHLILLKDMGDADSDEAILYYTAIGAMAKAMAVAIIACQKEEAHG